MPAAISAAQQLADLAATRDDDPVTLTWGGEDYDALRGLIDTQFQNDEVGYLANYRFSVWTPNGTMSTKPTPGKEVKINGTDHQVLDTGEDNGVIMRLDLGPPLR